MSKKMIEWEEIDGDHLGRVNGLSQYVCRIDQKSKKHYKGFELNSASDLVDITEPDTFSMTIARVENHHREKLRSLNEKLWRQ